MFKAKDVSYQQIWSELEGFALFINSGFLDAFSSKLGRIACRCPSADMPPGADDGEQVGACVEMVGHAALHGLALVKNGVSKSGESISSAIRNAGLVLGLFIKWAQEQLRDDIGDEEQTGWLYQMIEYAEKEGVVISAPYGFEKVVQKLKEDKKDCDKSILKKWKLDGWTKQVR
jgi:hypothetical protein